MIIYLVRHAQTEANAKRVIQGQTNTNITNLGYEQTKITASFFKNIKITQLFCSPLGRTVETAEMISLESRYPKKNIIKSKDLMEIDLTPWVGKTISELEKDKSQSGYGTYKENPEFFSPSDGEGFNDVKKRMAIFFDNIVNNFSKDSTIVVVSHSVAIRALLLYLENSSVSRIWDYDIKPASISLVETNCNHNVIKYVGYCPYL